MVNSVVEPLNGKIAFVTGASSGLGARMARVLAQAGAVVIIAARREDRLRALAEEIKNSGGRAYPATLNIRDPETVEKTIETVSQAHGPIDILINNAGVSHTSKAEEFTLEDYRFVMETNFDGPWFCAQSVGRRMIERGAGGKIINISSMLGLRPITQLAPYCASKAALNHLTHCLALEWARHNIQVNAICPGYIETEMNSDFWKTEAGRGLAAKFPRKRVGLPDAMDGAVLLLSSAQSDFITGTVIPVDDGQRFM